MPNPLKVRVSFDFYPDEPDPDDETGMSDEEHLALMDHLAQLGADNVEIERA